MQGQHLQHSQDALNESHNPVWTPALMAWHCLPKGLRQCVSDQCLRQTIFKWNAPRNVHDIHMVWYRFESCKVGANEIKLPLHPGNLTGNRLHGSRSSPPWNCFFWPLDRACGSESSLRLASVAASSTNLSRGYHKHLRDIQQPKLPKLFESCNPSYK